MLDDALRVTAAELLWAAERDLARVDPLKRDRMANGMLRGYSPAPGPFPTDHIPTRRAAARSRGGRVDRALLGLPRLELHDRLADPGGRRPLLTPVMTSTSTPTWPEFISVDAGAHLKLLE